MVSRSRKSRRRFLLRALAVLAAALVAVMATGAVGYRIFSGWRARDLAAKARENFEQGNYRMAWLQISSAKDMRGEEPDVLRVMGLIEGAMGRAEALDYYEKISQKAKLTPDDIKMRAEIAMRCGDDAQFAQAAEALEASGQVAEAAALRTARKLRKGDIDRAIAAARAAADVSADPALKLSLARLLVQRYRPEFGPGRTPSAAAVSGTAEAAGIIDGFLDTPRRNEVLAFALNEVNAAPADRQRWAAAAMEKIEAENPALLPAAAVLVRSRKQTPQQIHEQLRPIYDAAPLERRAAYALWLVGAGLPKEALTLITAQEAGQSTAAFGARTEALFAINNPDAVVAAVEAGGNIDADVRLAAKARAEYGRGRGAQSGAQSLREAMDAAARSGRLELIIPAGDALGASAVVDEKIAELCGDPSFADYVFRVARDRFSRAGRSALLSASLQRARTALPRSASVGDYTRYTALTRGEPVSLEETAAACADEPANVTFRITHALNLLKRGESATALKAFDDITVFADRLPPGQLAVIAAVLAANGESKRAVAVAKGIDPDLLLSGEYALIAPLRAKSAGP